MAGGGGRKMGGWLDPRTTGMPAALRSALNCVMACAPASILFAATIAVRWPSPGRYDSSSALRHRSAYTNDGGRGGDHCSGFGVFLGYLGNAETGFQ